jgi:hypothetical protein
VGAKGVAEEADDADNEYDGFAKEVGAVEGADLDETGMSLAASKDGSEDEDGEEDTSTDEEDKGAVTAAKAEKAEKAVSAEMRVEEANPSMQAMPKAGVGRADKQEKFTDVQEKGGPFVESDSEDSENSDEDQSHMQSPLPTLAAPSGAKAATDWEASRLAKAKAAKAERIAQRQRQHQKPMTPQSSLASPPTVMATPTVSSQTAAMVTPASSSSTMSVDGLVGSHEQQLDTILQIRLTPPPPFISPFMSPYMQLASSEDDEPPPPKAVNNTPMLGTPSTPSTPQHPASMQQQSPSSGVLLCFGLEAVFNKHIRECPDAMGEVTCIGNVQVLRLL